MVCIAAFIVLCFLSLGVAFLSIFKPAIGKKWWQVFKKAWYCVFKKVRLQKCDTNFKDDVKNTILKKFILKKPHLVKPISIAIEAVSVLIVFITIWSIVIAIKSLLALWIFGTCNISQPSQCGLGAEACTIDQAEPKNIVEHIGRNFDEWGQIFSAIPDRLKTWRAEDYLPQNYQTLSVSKASKSQPIALDIFDPGCSVCAQSYKNQKSNHFLDQNNTVVLPYAITLPDGSEKYKNSQLISRFIYATAIYEAKNPSAQPRRLVAKIIDRLFTEYDQNHINYQTVFSQDLSETEARELLKTWLKDFKLNQSEIESISKLSTSKSVENYIKHTEAVVAKLQAKSIPILIYNGRKHQGLFK